VAARTGTDELYAEELGELWAGLLRTLTRLDVVAAEPDLLDTEGAERSLRRLQYSLHVSSENVAGLQPPPGGETAHAELAAALACARDATADVAEAVSVFGASGVEPLLHEWRGALFRVRLARMRLAPASKAPIGRVDDDRESILRPLAAFLVALFGALAFVGGAVTADWPLWVTGLVAVCAAVLVYRP
jgi:hypothetical protein